MKKTIHFILLIFIICGFQIVSAQNDINVESHFKQIKGMYVGAQISTNGYGFEASYLFNKGLDVRAGWETLNLSTAYNFVENDI